MAQGFSSTPVADSVFDDAPEDGLKKVWRWGAVIAVGGFLFGFDTGVVSGALLFFKHDFDLNSFEQGSVVSVLLLGAMAGALLAGRAGGKFGRRRTFAAEGAIFLAGTAIVVTADSYEALLVGRVVLGLAVGGASATVPVYLSEIAPPSIRGRILTMNQLMITVGILFAYFVNLAFSGSEDWRAMFAVGAIPSLIMLLSARWLPESPSWQLVQGRADEARATIAAVSGEHRADDTVKRFRDRTAAEERSSDPTRKGWSVLLASSVRPALIVGLTLAVVQQFGGINTIIYYAPTIIEQTGLTASNAIFYSVAIGVINLGMTIVSIRLVDRVGRKPLLTTSLIGMIATLALLGLAFVADFPSGVMLLFMVLYIGFFAIGLGPIFWVLIGEVFPAQARAAGSGAATAANWTANFAISLAFLPLVSWLGQGETFWLFAVVCVLGLFFVGRFVPETRDREFDEIDDDLQKLFGRAPQRT